MARRGLTDKNSSGRKRQVAFVGNDLVRIVQALAALRGAAELGVKLFGTIAAAACGGAQVFFADGIADADVHALGPSG